MKFLLLFVAVRAFATDLPPDDKVIQRLSQGASRGDLPAEVRLLNWNIEKGEQGEAFTKDFPAFAADRNVVLLQEGYQAPAVLGALEPLAGISFFMANAFTYKGFLTGVIGGFGVEPSELAFRRSPQREPILNSPKMSLIASFGPELKIVNVHGINFVGPDKLKNQLDDVAKALQGYTGKVIMAGDFNTWNDARLQVVLDAARALGLAEVPFTRTGSAAVLDHVFQRGCAVEKAWVVEGVKSSDHDPEFVDLNCKENP